MLISFSCNLFSCLCLFQLQLVEFFTQQRKNVTKSVFNILSLFSVVVTVWILIYPNLKENE